MAQEENKQKRLEKLKLVGVVLLIFGCIVGIITTTHYQEQFRQESIDKYGVDPFLEQQKRFDPGYRIISESGGIKSVMITKSYGTEIIDQLKQQGYIETHHDFCIHGWESCIEKYTLERLQ